MDDPSGYSTIENLHLPYPDPKLEIRYYGRTAEQDKQLGFYSEEDRAAMHGESVDNCEPDKNLDLSQVKTRVRNPWLALFELTNDNTMMCTVILEFVL